jgi:alkanesulfonate monooxygenase SsuD/methylene tetrahydromethanopterin reductase-like flavin-dependent oxidoreductase (luciferase family)
MKMGVVLPLMEYPQWQPSYNEIRELALQAEEANFDSIWLFDHLLFRSPGQPTKGIWECWTILAAFLMFPMLCYLIGLIMKMLL